MKLAKQMRRIGQIGFIIMGITFGIFFIGMVTMPTGGYDLQELPPLVQIAVIIALVAFAPTLILLLGSNIPRVLANRALKANGLPAEARILKIWETGMRINRKPVLRLLLEVRPPYEPTFEAETEQLFSVTQRLPIYPGSIVPVKYNPDSLEVAILTPEDH